MDPTIGPMANIAVVLAAFGFAGFILLLNHAADTGNAFEMDDLEGRAAFLLAVAFGMGVLAAFLFASSASQLVRAEAFVIAEVLFALEVIALVGAVIVLVDKFLAPPGPEAAWLIGASLIVFVVGRIVWEIWRSWTSQAYNWGNPIALLWSALIPVILGLGVWWVVRGAGDGPRRWVREFFSERVIVFAFFMAALGVIVAVAHAALVSRSAAGFPPWANVGLLAMTFSLGAVGAWSLSLSWPRNTEAKRRAR